MPVTPFHFGVGALAKGLIPDRLSLTAFIASQVVIDCESGYFILAREWPLHRWVHTFAVATPVGLAAGLSVWAAGVLWRRRSPHHQTPASAESRLWPGLLGGFLGGLTHPFLDGIMHSDIQPLRPFSPGNPFLGLIGISELYLLCVAAGAIGVVLLGSKGRLPDQRGERT